MTARERLPAGTYSVLTGAGPAAVCLVQIAGALVTDFLRRHVRWVTAGADSAIATGNLTPPAGTVRRATLVDADSAPLDEILVSFHGPSGADARLHLHGSPPVLQRCEEMLAAVGFQRIGEAAGLWHAQDAIEREFHAILPRVLTLRGAEWLARNAESLRGVLHCILNSKVPTEQRAFAATISVAGVDFVERLVRPLRIALVGAPNAGKSTLLNALADQAVSIVSPMPGTTRDWVEAGGEIDGFPCTWVDTAGLRNATDPLEASGVAKSWEVIHGCDAIVLVLDGVRSGVESTRQFVAASSALQPTVIAWNKSDAPDYLPPPAGLFEPRPIVQISAANAEGLCDLAMATCRCVGIGWPGPNCPCAFTLRQVRYCSSLRAATAESSIILAASELMSAR